MKQKNLKPLLALFFAVIAAQEVMAFGECNANGPGAKCLTPAAALKCMVEKPEYKGLVHVLNKIAHNGLVEIKSVKKGEEFDLPSNDSLDKVTGALAFSADTIHINARLGKKIFAISDPACFSKLEDLVLKAENGTLELMPVGTKMPEKNNQIY